MNGGFLPAWQLFLSYVASNAAPILIGLVFFNILILLIVIGRRSDKKFRNSYLNLLQGVHTDNLEEVILYYQNRTDLALNKIQFLEEKTKNMEQQLQLVIQKLGVVRFNAFPDVGSDLSFAVALLDNENNGVVISSIFGRDESRSFAKPIHGGKSSYRLTDEELSAIAKATAQADRTISVKSVS